MDKRLVSDIYCGGERPYFSVVIPLYNKENYIKQTIDSLLKQSFTDFEIVVVDDGSKDKGPEIVQSIEDKRIKLFRKENGGVSSARNYGIEKACADLICFLDADDYVLPNHLEELRFLSLKYGDKSSVFCTNFTRLFPDGESIPNINPAEVKRGVLNNYFKDVYRGHSFLCSSNCSICKDALINSGGFNAKYRTGEDIDLWMRLARRHKVTFSTVVTAVYIIGAENNSSSARNNRYDSAKDALCVKFYDSWDLRIALIRWTKYVVKRMINHTPKVRKGMPSNNEFDISM